MSQSAQWSRPRPRLQPIAQFADDVPHHIGKHRLRPRIDTATPSGGNEAVTASSSFSALIVSFHRPWFEG